MSDRFPAELRIGGPVPRKLVPALCREITAADVSLDWGDSSFSPTAEVDLRDAARDSFLVLRDDQANYGEFPDLEDFLKKYDIAYDRHSTAKYEHDGELVRSRPGKGLVWSYAADNGEALVPLGEVKKVQAVLRAGDAATALTLLDKLCPAVPSLEPLTFGDLDVELAAADI